MKIGSLIRKACVGIELITWRCQKNKGTVCTAPFQNDTLFFRRPDDSVEGARKLDLGFDVANAQGIFRMPAASYTFYFL